MRAQTANAADIYAEPDFSSKKIEHLNAETVVIIRTEKHVGKGGMGVFYKVKTSSGKIGYITDADLVTESGKIKSVKVAAPASPPPVPPRRAEPEPVAAPVLPPEHSQRTPEYKSLWGATVAIVNYSEKLRGQSYSKMHLFAGARRTQIKAHPMAWRQEAAVLFTAGAPRFLTDAGAFGQSSGFIFLGEYLFIRPLITNEKFNLFGALGPMTVYSKYSTNFSDGPYSRTSLRPGLVLDVGGSIKVLRKNHLRIDLKIYLEQTFYTSQTVTFQFPL